MKAISCARAMSQRITFYQSDMGARATVEELLLAKGYAFESPDLTANYQAYMLIWKEIFDQHNTQFIYRTAHLPAGDDDPWHRHKDETIGETDYRVVNDGSILKLAAMETTIRVPSLARMEEDGTEDATDVFEIPTHPWVYVFNLETHKHMWIEPHLMRAYSYDTRLVDRLILPETHKDLIRLLTANADVLQADFVRGKSAGTIILAAGEPGTGKTFTAEAFAEGKHGILYRVQSDQLGISAEGIEKNLKAIFGRADRWKAILLIDECDIFVRERGIDIGQNAIVGTLLRTLEYFNGVIFMTTNIATVIDDAIASRCSAVVTYNYPTFEHAQLIFRQFAGLFELTCSELTMTEFLTNRQISGRTIKNLLRLIARRGIKDVTLADLNNNIIFLR